MPCLIALKILGNIGNDYLHLFGVFSPLFQIQNGCRRPFWKKNWSLFFNAKFDLGHFKLKKKKILPLKKIFFWDFFDFFFCVLSKCHFVIYVYCSLKPKKMLLCLKIALSQGCPRPLCLVWHGLINSTSHNFEANTNWNYWRYQHSSNSINPLQNTYGYDIALAIVLQEKHVDALVTNYNQGLTALIEKHAPLHRKKLTLHPNSPWYTQGLHDAKHQKRKLERKWRNSGLEIDRQAYRTQCSVMTKLLYKTRADYYSMKIEECNKDQARLHRTAKQILGVKKGTSLPRHTSSDDLAEQFSKFFTDQIANIGASFNSNSHDTMRSSEEYHGSKLYFNFKFHFIKQTAVMQTCTWWDYIIVVYTVIGLPYQRLAILDNSFTFTSRRYAKDYGIHAAETKSAWLEVIWWHSLQ